MTYMKKAGHILALVIHDPAVQRSGRQFAVKVGVRLLIAAGCSVEVAAQVAKLVS